MNPLFWLPIFFATPSHDTACQARGTPLLEIRERSETSAAVTTKRIYASGAWTLSTEDATARGCFSQQELRAIRRAVQRAPWHATKSRIACFAYDPNFTEYVVHGRLRYTHRLCSGSIADARTLAAIEVIQRELSDELPPAPPPLPAFEAR